MLTVNDVLAMTVSLIAPDDRLELFGGVLYAMASPSSRQAAVVDRLSEALSRYRTEAIRGTQNPTKLSEHDLVEPYSRYHLV